VRWYELWPRRLRYEAKKTQPPNSNNILVVAPERNIDLGLHQQRLEVRAHQLLPKTKKLAIKENPAQGPAYRNRLVAVWTRAPRAVNVHGLQQYTHETQCASATVK
jgi:hypothetical protein